MWYQVIVLPGKLTQQVLVFMQGWHVKYVHRRNTWWDKRENGLRVSQERNWYMMKGHPSCGMIRAVQPRRRVHTLLLDLITDKKKTAIRKSTWWHSMPINVQKCMQVLRKIHPKTNKPVSADLWGKEWETRLAVGKCIMKAFYLCLHRFLYWCFLTVRQCLCIM